MSDRARQAPLGGRRWNAIDDRIRERVAEIDKSVRQAVLADGFPPLYDAIPNDPRARYEHLVALRSANDPRYWDDPTAVKELATLAQRFGPPPAPPRTTPGPEMSPYPQSAPSQPFPMGGP